MNFLQRALKSVTRKKGRSIILFLVIFILGNVIAGSVAIEQSTKNVEKETKRQMGATATVQMDYEKLDRDQQKDPEKFENGDYWQPPTLDVYEQIGKLSYVKYFDYSIPSWIGTVKFKMYQPEGDNTVYYGTSVTNQLDVKGVNRKEVVDIEEGLIKLDEGEVFSDKDISEGANNVIISKELSETNNLSVGDQVVLDVSEDMGEMMSADEENEAEAEDEEDKQVMSFDFPVKVIGIFSVVRKEEDQPSKDEQNGYSDTEWIATQQINTIYMPNELVKKLEQQRQQMYAEQYGDAEADVDDTGEDYYNPTYVLKSPDDVEAFREEADALIPQEYYKIMVASDQYDQVAGGMQKLGTISKYVVIIAVAATIMIITLVVLLFLRDRKHELGIYLSLGEGRGKIIGQVVIELLVISALALVLSLVTGKFLGGIVSDSLLQTDWLSNANSMDGMYYGSSLMSTDISYQDIQDAYQINFSAGYIISYLGLGLGTVLLSAVMPLLYILRLNPKKIMM